MTHAYIPLWGFLLVAAASFAFGAFLGRISK